MDNNNGSFDWMRKFLTFFRSCGVRYRGRVCPQKACWSTTWICASTGDTFPSSMKLSLMHSFRFVGNTSLTGDRPEVSPTLFFFVSTVSCQGGILKAEPHWACTFSMYKRGYWGEIWGLSPTFSRQWLFAKPLFPGTSWSIPYFIL